MRADVCACFTYKNGDKQQKIRNLDKMDIISGRKFVILVNLCCKILENAVIYMLRYYVAELRSRAKSVYERGWQTMEYPICDLHGHFLPDMDDGCTSVEESVQVLKSSYAQGVRVMFATPHYYTTEPIDEFLERREVSARTLFQQMEQEEAPLPQIILGAEVAYRPGLGYEDDLEKLCLGNSRYLLLEMPFLPWNDEVVRSVRNICVSKGITPIIAHIERYLPLQSRDMVMQVLEQDVMVQMNAEHLLHLSTRRQARRLLNDGVVHLLGTDCHNMTNRPPNMAKAIAYLKKKRMDYILSDASQLSHAIFEEALCAE